MASIRPRGCGAVLRAAAARGRNDQVEPQQDHRRGHRLALLQRAQAGAEGVSRMRAALVATIVALASLIPAPPYAVRDQAVAEEPLPEIGPAPDFALTSQDGVPVALADFR